MADDNLSAPAEPVAVSDVPKTQDELIGSLSNLLDAPATDHVEEAEDKTAAAAPAPEDDPLGLNADVEDDGEVDPDAPDGPQAEVLGGRFAPDTAKVKLDDGSVISVAELKRNNLYHAGFTQKTQALAKDVEAFTADRQKVAEYAQSLSQFRDYVASYAEQHLPQRPEPFTGAPDDYVGFIEWQRKEAAWQTHATAYQAFQQQKKAENDRQAGETKQQADARVKVEADKLRTAIPVLNDPAKAKAFHDALVSGASTHFGITQAEVDAIGDHRMVLVLREAIAARTNKTKAPQAQQEAARRPAIRPGQRPAPNAAAAREKQARTEQLRKTGSFEDGVAALSHFKF